MRPVGINQLIARSCAWVAVGSLFVGDACADGFETIIPETYSQNREPYSYTPNPPLPDASAYGFGRYIELRMLQSSPIGWPSDAPEPQRKGNALVVICCEGQQREKFEHTFFHGVQTFYHPNGQLAGSEVWEYHKPAPGGSQTWYHDTGIVHYRIPFVGFDHPESGWNGTHRIYHPDGRLRLEVPMVDGQAHGTVRMWTVDQVSGPSAEENWIYGYRVGPARYFHPDGQPCAEGAWAIDAIEGGFTDGMCGLWKFWDRSGNLRTADFGPCENAMSPLPDNEPYPPLDLDNPDGAEISLRGHVRDARTGDPIEGATILLDGADPATTDARGFYLIVTTGSGLRTAQCSAPVREPQQRTVDFTFFSYRTLNFDLVRPGDGTAPVIVSAVSKMGNVFIEGLLAPNEYDVEVDWNGGAPGFVEFDVNGIPRTVAADAAGGRTTFDMGTQFIADASTTSNVLTITAINEEGERSEPVALHPVVLARPAWAVQFGNFVPVPEGDKWRYTIGVGWPVPPLDVGIDETSLVWPVWSTLPVIGRPFGAEGQALGWADFYSDGTGRVRGEAKAVIKGAGAELEVLGRLAGSLAFNANSDSATALEWSGATMTLRAIPSFVAKANPSTAFPFLRGFFQFPLGIGSFFRSLDKRGEIKGEFGAGLTANWLITENEDRSGLTFAPDEVEIPIRSRFTYKFKAHPKIHVEGRFGGTVQPKWTIGDTVEFKGWSGRFASRTTVKLFRLAYFNEEEWPMGLPGGDPGPVLIDTSGGWSAAATDYINAAPYHQLQAPQAGQRAPRGADPDSVTSVLDENSLFTNTNPDSEPAVAATDGGEIAIAYVYVDPDDGLLRNTEIHVIRSSDGGFTFGAPEELSDDTRAEFSPAVAFDSQGRVVCVWERVSDPALVADEPGDILPEMEIVYASFDPGAGSWSAPVSLTANTQLDHSPTLVRGPAGGLCVAWQTNAGNHLVGNAASPSEIRFAVWDASAGDFGAAQSVPGVFENLLEFDFAFNGGDAVLLYTQDLDGDFAIADDTELFFVELKAGAWGARTRLTDDSVPDSAPRVSFCTEFFFEAVWINGSNMVRLLDETTTGAFQVIRDTGGDPNALDFHLACNEFGELALIWKEQRAEQVDLYYRVFDTGLFEWGGEIQLVDDVATEYDLAAAFTGLAGIHLTYLKEDADTGLSDLVYAGHFLGRDLAVSFDNGVPTDIPNPAAGAGLELRARVHNLGELAAPDPFDAAALEVAFYLGDPEAGGQLIGVAEATQPGGELAGGRSAVASLPWVVPGGVYDGGTAPLIVAVVDPDDNIFESRDFNNRCEVPLARADLSADDVDFRDLGIGSGELNATISNGGPVKAEAFVVRCSVAGNPMVEYSVACLPAGSSAEITFIIPAEACPAESCAVTISLDPYGSVAESDEGNNEISSSLPIFSGSASLPYDSDGDLLPDDWELEHFGDLARDGTGDYDDDGLSDFGERIAGTDPTDPKSLLKLGVVPDPSSGGNVLRWDAKRGKHYIVQFSHSLREGEWVEIAQVFAFEAGEQSVEHVPVELHGVYRIFMQSDSNL